jgi:hypothetical protein
MRAGTLRIRVHAAQCTQTPQAKENTLTRSVSRKIRLSALLNHHPPRICGICLATSPGRCRSWPPFWCAPLLAHEYRKAPSRMPRTRGRGAAAKADLCLCRHVGAVPACERGDLPAAGHAPSLGNRALWQAARSSLSASAAAVGHKRSTQGRVPPHEEHSHRAVLYLHPSMTLYPKTTPRS